MHYVYASIFLLDHDPYSMTHAPSEKNDQSNPIAAMLVGSYLTLNHM